MSLVEGLHTQAQVVYALILRETRTRFGNYRLGYLWAVMEPLFWVLTLYGVFYFTHRAVPDGMDPVGFLITGIMPFLMWRQSMSQVVGAIKSNKPLLYYPQVRPLDLVISRSLLEFATILWVFILIAAGHALATKSLAIDDLLVLIGGFVLAWLLGTGTGLLLLVLVAYFSFVERLISAMMRPMFFISGVFFTANELPQEVREYLLWNPLLHATEMVREGYYQSYTAYYLDVPYVLMVIGLLLYLGLILERLARKQMSSS